MTATHLETFAGARVLITGGLGFIGSNLARALVPLDAEVVLVDSLIPEYGGNRHNIAGLEDSVTVNIADVRDPHSMRHLVQGVDVLFNLAGQTSHLDSMRDPYTDLDINARAQLTILEACRLHNPSVRIVFASTRQIYGRPRYLPVDEEHPVAPIDVNGVNKVAGEWYHRIYGAAYGLSTTSLRLTNTYGPGMRVKDARQTFLGIWIRNAIGGDPIIVFGDGAQKRDFTYVDDIVQALLRVAVNRDARGRVLNIGGGPPLTLAELAELLVQCNGGGRVIFKPFPVDLNAIDIGDYYCDDSLARRLLHWEPYVSLEDGLGATVEYYRKHRDFYF